MLRPIYVYNIESSGREMVKMDLVCIMSFIDWTVRDIIVKFKQFVKSITPNTSNISKSDLIWTAMLIWWVSGYVWFIKFLLSDNDINVYYMLFAVTLGAFGPLWLVDSKYRKEDNENS